MVKLKGWGLTFLVIMVAMCACALAAPAYVQPTPYMIYGHVYYENDTACDGSVVSITNTNTSVEWQADTNAGYNYYQLILADELLDIKPEIETLGEGDFSIEIPAQRALRAGVLAINTHKSIYLPDETAFIGMAVLDNEGHMVCDAEVTLTITDPSNKETVLSTCNGLIRVSPECCVYGITNLPDYYTNYVVGGVGTYVMNLTAATPDGTGTKSITDEFVVQNSVAFDVARDGPTRIYPPVAYVMNFTIKANKNHTGLIKEYVPASFVITPQDGLTVSTVGDTKILSWNRNLVKGEIYNIYYEFDAPDISPYLFVLGALEIGGFKEAKQWQIASDTPDTETLYVNGKNDTYTDWTEVGDSPYLNDNDANYIYTKVDGNKEGEFNFANPSGSGTIHSVTIYFECRQTSLVTGSEKFEPFLYDGSSWTKLTDVIPAEGGTYTWKSEDVSTKLNTWTKITDAEMYVVYQKVGNPSVETIYIRRAYLYVDYTPPPDIEAPTYTNDADNSTGSVIEGEIVNTHVYWADAYAGDTLSKAVLRTNKTGEWTNESWHTFSVDPEWANITFDTTGLADKTICWVQWANDTSNNWNTSMSTTAHCFNVVAADETLPTWQNQGQNNSAPAEGEAVLLYAQGKDETALDFAILETNETGGWLNITDGSYGSPKDMGDVTDWTWSNFTWQNSSITVGTTVGWRMWYNDTSNNWNVTDIQSFVVTTLPPPPSTPYMIYGWVNYITGAPVNNPTVSINNTNTSEIFTAETNESYNYYQVLTSSDNVSKENILHFNASNGNVKEFNHTITEAEINSTGGFVRNITISGIANHVVISEIYVDAINETENNRSEFVELYNPTDVDKILSGWTLSNLEGTITLSGTIYAHKFYLVGMIGYNDYKDNASWPYADIQAVSNNFSLNNNGDEVILNNSAGEIVDTVGWGTATTNETLNADTPGENESLQRKINATITEDGYGPAWDTNNNSADFFIQTTPNPQNLETDPVPPIPELPTLILFSTGLLALAGYVWLTKRRR